MGGRKLTDDDWIEFLNRIVLTPRIKTVCRSMAMHPTTAFNKIRASIQDPDAHKLLWLDTLAPFSDHLTRAKALSREELDREALTLALEGHRQKRFDAAGRPVWVRDPQIESDALSMDDDTWALVYGPRRRDDTYLRVDGKLVQEEIVTPVNGALAARVLAAHLPHYKESSTVEHRHSGGVWIAGAPVSGSALPRGDTPFLGFDAPPEQQQRPDNLLALPHPCATTGEFDKKFRKHLLRAVVLFWDEDGKLRPPLSDDTVVAGTPQARAFEDAGIAVTLVRAETLLDQGYENPWLHELAPGYKPRIKPKPVPAPMPAEEVAAKVEKKYRSMEDRAEGIGHPPPPPGGYKCT